MESQSLVYTRLEIGLGLELWLELGVRPLSVDVCDGTGCALPPLLLIPPLLPLLPPPLPPPLLPWMDLYFMRYFACDLEEYNPVSESYSDKYGL